MASNPFGTVGWQGFTPAKPATNPFTTITNTKSPEVEPRLAELFKQFDTLKSLGTTSLTDYTTALNQNTPQLRGFATSDIGALNDIASGRTSTSSPTSRQRRQRTMRMPSVRITSTTRTCDSGHLVNGAGILTHWRAVPCFL